MADLRRSLNAFEAFILSLAIIAPTLGMAFNVSLSVQAAGRAAPLAFLIGGLGMAMVGLSFVAFGRRIADAGSASAYVEAAFGPRFGFLAGWGLLLAYLSFLASATALVGGFLAVALAEHAGLALPGLWQAIAGLSGLLVIRLGGREIARLTFIMLAIEAAAVLAIVVLAAVILTRVPLSAAPFVPDPERGWSGVGYGMVFAVLSLAGFEGAATVAEETHDPHRAIPRAVLGSLAVATLLFVAVSYAEVLGYGLDPANAGMRALGAAQAPLDALSTRFLSGGYAAFLDAAAGISSLACALGTASAAARVLFALGRRGFGSGRGLGSGFAEIDPEHGAPRRAVRAVGAANLVALAACGGWVSPRAYSEACATIATLVLILVYIGVALAQMRDSGRRPAAGIGGLGAVLMAWPFLNSLYPVPDWPGPLWPAVVLAWMGAGLVLARRLPIAPRNGPRGPAHADGSAGKAAEVFEAKG